MRTLLLVALLAGCGARPIPTATEADATRARARYPGTTAAELNHGRALLLARCGACHQPPAPGAKKAAEWPPHVREMIGRAGVTAPDAALIERYLTSFAADQVAAALTPAR